MCTSCLQGFLTTMGETKRKGKGKGKGQAELSASLELRFEEIRAKDSNHKSS